MTTQVLTPEKAAFVELSVHCVECPDCRANPDQPQAESKCPEAKALYRAWFILWRKEACS